MGRMANTYRWELEQALEPSSNRGQADDWLLYLRAANRKLSRFRDV